MKHSHSDVSLDTSATGSPTANVMGKPNYEDVIAEYMRTRVVYSEEPVCILVDAFRHASAFQSQRVRQWSQSCGLSAPLGGDVAPTGAHTFLYFLSHFHSDHYTGLSGSWSYGTILCTPGTARLIQRQLRVPAHFIQPLEYGEPYLINLSSGAVRHASSSSLSSSSSSSTAPTCRVRLVPANHCPEAAILVFECPSPVGTVVHTGDLRFNRTLAQWRQHALGLGGASTLSADRQALRRCLISPETVTRANQSCDALLPLLTPFYEQFIGDNTVLTELAGQVDTLFLDNTFCDPAFRFPTQWDATQVVVETLRSLFLQSRGSPSSDSEGTSGEDVHIAVLIATYAIGKERVAFALQEAFQPVEAGPMVPIHVTPSKHDTLCAMDFFTSRFHRLPSSSPGSPREKQEEGKPQGESAEVVQEVHPRAVQVTLPITLRDAVAACADSVTTTASAVATPSASLSTNRTLDFDTVAQDASDPDPNDDKARGGPRYHLTLVLVPFGSLSYPLLAPACGARTRKRCRPSDDQPPLEPTAGTPLLGIGDGLGLALQKYDHVLAVMPTGWAKRPKTRGIADRCTQLDLPYSEHCSFDELLDFVALLNPRHVVPTVSTEQFRAQESLFVERAPRLRAQHGATQPLTRFWKSAAQEERDAAESHKAANPFLSVPSSVRGATTTTAFAPLAVRTPNALPTVSRPTTTMKEPKKASESALTAYGVTCQRRSAAARQEDAAEAESDEDCVVIVGVTNTVVEISDGDSDA